MACLAGVSPGTASKALNGRSGISLSTAERARQAADRLGYQPNALARGLLTGWSCTVGLMTTTVDMNLRELGRAAGERLLAAIDGQPDSSVKRLSCRLVARESSRPRHAWTAGTAVGSSASPSGPDPQPSTALVG